MNQYLNRYFKKEVEMYGNKNLNYNFNKLTLKKMI